MKGVLHNGMSLFQDLKLKRRKVDSRCSSDGESIGTSDSTSSLSPDAQGSAEGSPKDKDRCPTPEEMVVIPAVGKAGGYSPQLYIVMKDGTSGRKDKSPPSSPYDFKSNGVIKLTNNHNSLLGSKVSLNVLVKSEPNGVEDLRKSPEKVIVPPLITNGHSRSPSRSIENGHSSASSHGSDTEPGGSPTGVVIKTEKMVLDDQKDDGDETMLPHKDKMSPPPLLPRSPPRSRLESTLIITKAASSKASSPQSGHSSPSSNSSSRAPSRGSSPLMNGGSPTSIPIHSAQLHARLTNGPPPRTENHNVDKSLVFMSAGGHVMNGEKVGLDPPVSVVTSTSLSFHHHSMYRINGVRPEVISGGAVTPTAPNSAAPPQPTPPLGGGSNLLGFPQGNINGPFRKSPTLSRSPNSSPSNSSSSGSLNGFLHSPSGAGTIVAGGSLGMQPNGGGPHHHVNLNRTPTVIMGEAGGVRTMLWSQPGQNVSNPAAPVDLLTSPGSGSNHSREGSVNGNGGGSSSSSSTSSFNGHHQNSPPSAPSKGMLSMERLWENEAALNLSTGSNGASNTSYSNGGLTSLGNHAGDDDDFEQPMICMICEDRATGLHYGIITCEGCKGFFKRTVQNRRVYTCVADGTCEITKAQRNRCQYCRFKKCIEQGMVLQAVREDRMPGGRNSGAVYNLYKVPVKYRKHKKGNRATNGKAEKGGSGGSSPGSVGPTGPSSVNGNGGMGGMSIMPPQNGNILKAALTNPGEVTHLRPTMPFETAAQMISHLVQCDNFHDIAALQNWEELLEARGDLSEKLCQMGDSIVYRLVQWTKRLPFYSEVPVDVHTRVLTHKWHELLVLTTSAWQAMHTPGPPPSMSAEDEAMENLQVLQRCLQAMMGRSLTLEQLRQDVGLMVQRLTNLTRAFRRLGIRLEEYVTLKVIAMLQNTGTKAAEVNIIQDRYVKCLRTFVEVTCPSHPNRLNDLMRTLPEVQAAASLLLESKMFYVPFLLNSALLQR